MKISIIMTTYNRDKLIGNAIKSVLWQTHQDWELIVVDDGSTDNTKKVVAKFKDPRIKYINKGHQPYYTYVRNIGIKNSDGELLCYRDDDGMWDKNFLAYMAEPHKSPDVLITYCRRLMHTGINFSTLKVDNLDKLESLLVEKNYYMGRDSLSNILDVGDLMHKRSVFNESFTGFKEELDQPGYCSDAILVDMIDKNNPFGKIVLVDKPLHHYFLNHGASQMTFRKLEGRKTGKLVDEKNWIF